MDTMNASTSTSRGSPPKASTTPPGGSHHQNQATSTTLAMSTSVERSAECVLALLSANSLGGGGGVKSSSSSVNATAATITTTTSNGVSYQRSISSPSGCNGSGGESSASQSHNGSPSLVSSVCSPKRHKSATSVVVVTTAPSKDPSSGSGTNNNEYYKPCASPTPSLKSCPGAMGRGNTGSSEGVLERVDSRDSKSSGGSLENVDFLFVSEAAVEKYASLSPEDEEEEEEEEEDEYNICSEDTPSSYSEAGEAGDKSGADSIPDNSSFHTPSASIQNLSVGSFGGKELKRSGGQKKRRSKSVKSSEGSDSGNASDHHHQQQQAKTEEQVTTTEVVTPVSMTTSKNENSSPRKRDSGAGGGSGTSTPPAIKGSPELPHSAKTCSSLASSIEVVTPNTTVINTPESVISVSSSAASTADSTTSKDSNNSGGSVGSNNNNNKDQQYISPYYGPIKPNRKKMWYHVFTPSYKTRSNDFKKIFKELPSEERLIVDYSCALQKEILIQGRMYVSQNYISFHANIFGWETQTSIRLKDVTSITKEKTALVIPNAVQVSTETERFFFTSFVTRDSTYVMLFKLWQSSLLEEVRPNIPSKEIWKLVHSCYGDELGVASEEDPEDLMLACGPGGLVNAPSVSTLISNSDADDNKSMAESDTQVCASDLSSATTSNGLGHGGIETGEEHAVLISEHANGSNGTSLPVTSGLPAFLDTSDSEGESLPVPVVVAVDATEVEDASLLCLEIPVCPVSHSVGKTVTDALIPTDVNNLFTLLFTKSKFFQDFHTSRKTFDILQSDWRKSTDGSQNVRQVSFTVSLNHAMGPKHTQVTETQVMLPVSKPGVMYAIDVESVNAGIPYADSFYIQTHFCMTRISAQETKLIVINQIKYRKSVFSLTKGFIERNTWQGLEEFYKSLEIALKEECTRTCVTAPPTPASARSAPGSRRTGRKKYPAPSIPSASPNRSIGSELCKSPLLVNGVVSRSIDTSSTSSQTQAESSKVLKIILAVLGVLLVMNAFLYVKLTGFESKPQVMFSSPLSLSKNVPKNQKEWVSLLQQQEELHRLELQKWHEMLITSLKSLHQAEEDLESLKFHITSYNTGRHGVSALAEAIDELQESSPANVHNSIDHHQSEDDDRLPGGLQGSEEKVEL